MNQTTSSVARVERSETRGSSCYSVRPGCRHSASFKGVYARLRRAMDARKRAYRCTRATRYSRPLAQEDVIGGVGRAVEGAGLIAGAAVDATLGVDPLHRRDPRQRAAAAMRRHLELEPGDIARRL